MVRAMFAVTAARIDAENPLAGLDLGERPEPSGEPGWTTVAVRATALNHHDVWTLRGVGISPDRLPIRITARARWARCTQPGKPGPARPARYGSSGRR